ncbi:MAG: uroporphyrinogen decarboxylase family protein [Candidatus Dormibacteria bacterium]
MDGNSLTLSPRERLSRSQRGESLDRTPISFWRHFPDEDQDPTQLIEAMLAFQERYRLDLVKLMPSGMYSVVDYGAVTSPADPSSGARGLASGPIHDMSDFESLAPAALDRGSLGTQLSVAKAVRQAVPTDVPVIDTVFSPLTMAAKLSGRSAQEMIDSSPTALHRGLERLAADCEAFAQADLSAGIDGIFFAIQWAGRGQLSAAAQEEFGIRYDLRVLSALRPQSAIIMLHLHGPEPEFSLAGRYPVDWVNWEDTETPPSLADALGLTSAGLAGGITRTPAELTSSSDIALATIRSAIAATGGTRLLLAPGCVLPQESSALVLDTVRHAVDLGPARAPSGGAQ